MKIAIDKTISSSIISLLLHNAFVPQVNLPPSGQNWWVVKSCGKSEYALTLWSLDEDLFKNPWKSYVLKWRPCATLIASFYLCYRMFSCPRPTSHPVAWFDDAAQLLWRICMCIDTLKLRQELIFWSQDTVTPWLHHFLSSASQCLLAQADIPLVAWLDDAVNSCEESRCALMLWALNQN